MKNLRDERGAALILALLMIALLSVIAIMSTQTSTTETRIARNDRLQKAAFNEAEGGAHVGKELVEQNIEERNWSSPLNRKNSRIVDANFIIKSQLLATDFAVDPDAGHPADDRRDVYYPANNADGTPTTSNQPHTNLRIGSNTELSSGNAIQMVAGYEGLGKGLAGGGAWIVYDIRSQHQDVDNSRARIWARWRHVMK